MSQIKDNPLTLGNPSNAETSDNNYLIERAQYCLSYNRSQGRANWVAWHLSKSWLGNTERSDAFIPDPAIPVGWYLPTSSIYLHSGFDKGHLCPSSDRTTSEKDNSSTFLLSNIIPQNPQLNRTLWKNFENYCRQLAEIGNELYIISGTSGMGGTGDNAFSLFVDHVSIPSTLWKVVLVLPDGDNDLCRINDQTYVIGIVVPNGPVKGNWTEYIFSIDDIEELTGYNFFSQLSKGIQDALEH